MLFRSCPDAWRRQVTPLVEAALPWVKSEAAGRLAGPYRRRDWTASWPGESFQADDVTFNHEILFRDADGRPYLGRPEVLVLSDFFSGYPLAWVIQPGEAGRKASFNARTIRHLMLVGHDRHGLPDDCYRFEWGTFAAKDVEALGGKDELSVMDTVNALGSLGITIRHFRPRMPRGKTIEGDFHIIQDAMVPLPGHVGSNERNDKSDFIKGLEQRLRRVVPDETAAKHFMTLPEFEAALEKTFTEFANEPRGADANRTPGQSPREVWDAARLRKPLRRLGPGQRWALASIKRLARVTSQGILQTLPGQPRRIFANEELSRYLNDQVWTFSNMECPSVLTVADFKLTHFFTVNELTTKATGESREAMAETERQIAGFNKLPRAVAGFIKQGIASTISRDNDATPAGQAIGQVMADGHAAHQAERRQERKAAAAARRANDVRAKEIEQRWKEEEAAGVES